MRQSLRRLVWERAEGRCEYCRLPSEGAIVGFEIDHIIARKHQGPTTEENLALACVYCNETKGTDIASIDPESKEIVRLFHPRSDHWSEHFEWDGPQIVGRTAIGRATVQMMQMNEPGLLTLRTLLASEGLMKFS